MAKVYAVPFREENGKRILQCHSKGDKRFSPFYCFVEVNGVKRSIEDHYQCSKIFAGLVPVDWRQAKRIQSDGTLRTGWLICGVRFGTTEDLGAHFNVGVQFYIALWLKYLRAHPELVEYAKGFDEFEDPFKGSFPFCQADVIRLAVREGVEALKPLCEPLLRRLADANH